MVNVTIYKSYFINCNVYISRNFDITSVLAVCFSICCFTVNCYALINCNVFCNVSEKNECIACCCWCDSFCQCSVFSTCVSVQYITSFHFICAVFIFQDIVVWNNNTIIKFLRCYKCCITFKIYFLSVIILDCHILECCLITSVLHYE